MPLSPCSFRSAQCAALIALAAAAGIARVETDTPGSDGTAQPSLQRAATTKAPGEWSFFSLAARASAPWFQHVAAFAAWIVGDTETQQRDNGGVEGTDSATGVAIAASPPWAVKPVGVLIPVRPVRPFDAPSLCTLVHALPYAVGPPRCGPSVLRFAAGTTVPGDIAAKGANVRGVAPDEDSSFARLARLFSPHPTGGGSVSLPGPGFALRGNPSRFSRSALPPLGAPTRQHPVYLS